MYILDMNVESLILAGSLDTNRASKISTNMKVSNRDSNISDGIDDVIVLLDRDGVGDNNWYFITDLDM